MKEWLNLLWFAAATLVAGVSACGGDELSSVSRTPESPSGAPTGGAPTSGASGAPGAGSGGAGGGGGASGAGTASPVGVGVQFEAECAHGPANGSCFAKVSGEQRGTELQNSGNVVASLDAGDFLAYGSLDFAGVNVLATIYSATSSGNVEFRLDSPTGTLLAAWEPPPTGSRTSYRQAVVRLAPVDGVHTLYVVGAAGSGIATFDWFRLDACTPNCTDKACGDDGCGQSCGECTGTDSCTEAGQCEPCAPDCTGKTCGDDGCEGTCGAPCAEGEVCTAERACVPYATLGGPPRVHVEGASFVGPDSAPLVLRGVSLIDVGMQHEWRGGVPAMIDRLTGAGWETEIVRFPVYTAAQPRPFSLTDREDREQYMAEILRPAVDYATQKGLYVIIDFHEISNVTAQKDAEAQVFWRYMAAQFADYPNVIYEVFNEPIDYQGNCVSGGTDACWPPFKEKAEGWIEIIRETAPETLVLVGGPSWSQVIGPAADDPVSDGNVGYVSHIYPFHMGNDAVERQIRRCAAVHPVMLTEWGYGFEPGDEEPYLSVLKPLADDLGLSFTAWVADDSWGPPMFTSSGGLNDFGTFTQTWLAE